MLAADRFSVSSQVRGRVGSSSFSSKIARNGNSTDG